MSVDALAQTLRGLSAGKRKVQTSWAVAKEVEWPAGTMTATGIADDLDYFDVSLGTGHLKRKPKPGTLCLIGMIEGEDAAAFLLDAEEVEEWVLTAGPAVLTVKEEGFVMERAGESLTSLLTDLLNTILQSTYTNGAGTTSPPNNSPAFQAISNRLKNLLK